jgi:hypothetical protein
MRPASGPILLEELTPDDFVVAVMRTHDRIRSNLNALKRGATGSAAPESPDDAQIIGVYCLHHGVETHLASRRRHAGPRGLAV